MLTLESFHPCDYIKWENDERTVVAAGGVYSEYVDFSTSVTIPQSSIFILACHEYYM
jgi:hypothetical protein